MNLRLHKRTVIAKITAGRCWWPGIGAPTFSGPELKTGDLLQVFREAAGIEPPQLSMSMFATKADYEAEKAKQDLTTKLLAEMPTRGTDFDPAPLFDVRRKKDGVVVAESISREEADELIAAAKRQKKAALEIFNPFMEL